MNTLRMLASPRVWGPVLGLASVLVLIFYAYLGAVVSPERNLEDVRPKNLPGGVTLL